MRRRIFAIAAVLLTLLVMVGSPSRAGLMTIDRQEEIEFGRAAAARVERKVRLITSGPQYDRVQRLGRKVAAASGEDLPFTFKLIDDPTVNAFTFPGGFIYVFRGLLDQGLDDNALAGVLGHECAHAVKSHGFKVMKPMAILGKSTSHLPRVVKENVIGKLITIVTVEGVGRRFELEADAVGAGYAYKAGFDPEGLMRVFEMFIRLRSSQPSLTQKLLASHPQPEVRMKKLRPVIIKLKAGGR